MLGIFVNPSQNLRFQSVTILTCPFIHYEWFRGIEIYLLRCFPIEFHQIFTQISTQSICTEFETVQSHTHSAQIERERMKERKRKRAKMKMLENSNKQSNCLIMVDILYIYSTIKSNRIITRELCYGETDFSAGRCLLPKGN